MLTLVETATADDQPAHALLLRGQLAFASGLARDAIRLFMSAADQLKEIDPTVARETYLEAWAAAVFAGEPGGRHEPARRLDGGGSTATGGRSRTSRDLLEGLSTWTPRGALPRRRCCDEPWTLRLA